MIVNDYTQKMITNIDTQKIKLEFDANTNYFKPLRIYSHFTITLQNHKKDNFNKTYVELERPFNYPVLKKLLDQFKTDYPEYKTYIDLKKIYTKQLTRGNIFTLLGSINKEKKTINLLLRF